MPDFAVSVAIRGDDQISDNLRRLTKSVDRFGRGASQSFGMASRAAGVFKSVVGGILMSNVIGAGFNAMRVGASSVVREFLDMDAALVSAGAKFQLSKLGAEGASSAMTALAAAARGVGAETEFTAAQAAHGLEFLAMAGFTAEQAIAALPVMVDLATASSSDFARASDIASDALGAFGLASTDAQIQATNLQRITDVFAQTTASANVNMEDLFESMKMGAPIMTTAGQSLETFATMAAIMGNAGIKGSLGGTAIKNTVESLVNPVGKGAEMIAELGLKTQDSKGNMLDLADILEDFSKKTEKMGTAQRAAAISTVFGMRAASGIAAVLDNGIPAFRKYRDGITGIDGANKTMAETMRQSLGNRIEKLQSGLTELGIKVIDAFKEKFPGALDAAIAAVGSFDVGPIVDGIKGIIATVKSAWEWFDKWKYVIFALVGAFAIFKIALALTASVQLFIAVVTGATTISKVWAASQWAVNAALLANPITWIIAGVIALIAILALVIIYWDEIAAAWQSGLNSMYAGTNSFTNGVADFFGMMSASITNIMIDIDNAFSEVWFGMKMQAADTIAYIIGLWGKVKAMLGFDASGLPTREDLGKSFGIDETFKPMENIDYSDAAQGYKEAFSTGAMLMGANTDNPPPPNQAQREASSQDMNLKGTIDITAPEGYGAKGQSSSGSGAKAPDVDWRSKGGKNTGK